MSLVQPHVAIADLRPICACKNLIAAYASESSSIFESFRHLSGNRISQIPETFIGLRLRVLDLSRNHITSLEGLEELSSLETLNVSGNLIVTYREIRACSRLVTLDLSSNKIGKLDLVTLTSLNSLKCLYFSGNPIEEYRVAIIAALPSLGFLDNEFVH